MIDSHCHLNFEQYYADLPQVLDKMSEFNVKKAVVVGVNIDSNERALELAREHSSLFAACGFHPTEIDLDGDWPKDLGHLERQLSFPECRALGEVGLDFVEVDNQRLTEDQQLNCLKDQVLLAKQLNKPVIFHVRQAKEQFIEFLNSDYCPKQAVVHCFEGDRDFLKILLDKELMVSVSGLITYPKNQFIRDAVAYLPPERTMIETDCPFLVPYKQKNRRNDPTGVILVAERVAEIWKKPVTFVENTTAANASDFFTLGV